MALISIRSMLSRSLDCPHESVDGFVPGSSTLAAQKCSDVKTGNKTQKLRMQPADGARHFSQNQSIVIRFYSKSNTNTRMIYNLRNKLQTKTKEAKKRNVHRKKLSHRPRLILGERNLRRIPIPRKRPMKLINLRQPTDILDK